MAVNDLDVISQTARDLAYRQLDAQLQAGSNFDAKTVGVLGFDGAALGAVLATKDLFHGWWAITVIGLMISAFCGGMAIVAVGWDVGPDARTFYDNSKAGGMKPGGATTANLFLSAHFGKALENNDRLLKSKARNFGLALWFVGVTAIVTAGLLAFRP